MNNPFDHNYFLGYVNEITPQYVKIHFPSSSLLSKFHHDGVNFAGGNVGNFIIIEGEEYGFLARIIKLNLPDSEKKEINENKIKNDQSKFHPSGEAELLLSFDLYKPDKISKTVSKYPCIGAKVYSCSDEQMSKYVEKFGEQKDDSNNIYAELGELTSNNAKCNISLNSLFGRHCAIVGTTGGGKSWTVAKLTEIISSQTNNKVILIDATGEYSTIEAKSVVLGTDAYFPYQKLSITDLFYLLRPTGQSQRPILLEAIRSLKVVRLKNSSTATANQTIYMKTNTQKQLFIDYYRQNISSIEDDTCNFDIGHLVEQIKEECIYQNGGTFNSPNPSLYGGYDNKTYDYQTSLISRITDLINTDVFNKSLGFKQVSGKSIVEEINSFVDNGQKDNSILRISFEDMPSSFSAKEIISNALASYLLNLARNKKFKDTPLVLILDEAHQFLNKSVSDDFFENLRLEAFDLIAKECRKYGLFLCLATQMPRDIPIGTLSQIGTFIVHRLINEQDKKAIENASSSANRNVLSFLPILGEGEALLISVDFPMPLLIKLYEPSNKPNSNTPKLSKKN
jgi:DNA helicase HerA-like ATPase